VPATRRGDLLSICSSCCAFAVTAAAAALLHAPHEVVTKQLLPFLIILLCCDALLTEPILAASICVVLGVVIRHRLEIIEPGPSDLLVLKAPAAILRCLQQ
jgi:hypothetical protein